MATLFQKYSHAAMLILLSLCFFRCSNEVPAQAEPAKTSKRITNVSVYPIAPDSLIQYSRWPATVKAWRDVSISALEPGVVMAILKDVGDIVLQGEVLARLNLDVLESAAIEVEANLKLQTYNYENSKRLFAEGSISEQAHYEAEYDYNRAKSAAQTIQKRLSYGQIRAPFSGQIAQRFVELGQLVPTGGPTFRLVQTHQLRVETWVAESEIADFSEGNPVELTLDTFLGETFSGIIGHIGPATQSDQRVFPVEIHLQNPDARIRTGMIGKIKAVRQIYRNAVVIPREAVLERETGPAAFVVENDTGRLHALRLGPAEGDRVLVQNGLSFGDRLIVKGGRDLIEGDRIEIQYTEPKP